jgi:DNA-binding winged helix-turn-helix (wHTH) protein
MEILFPSLQVSGPAGQQFRVELTKDRLTIGRFELLNDVALTPDPQQLITRLGHCVVEHDVRGWWVVDNSSVNHTLIERGQTRKVIQGRAALIEGDRILILGMVDETGTPLYWELTFHDPLSTRPSEHAPSLVYLTYDESQARLFRVDGRDWQRIHLPWQEHKLVRYMDWRNQASGYVPVVCSYADLLEAIWEKEACYHNNAEITHLVGRVRKKIEANPEEPKFLVTVRGLGYCLITCPLPHEKYPPT